MFLEETMARAIEKTDEKSIETYKKQGVLYIPQALTTEEVECLRKGIELNLNNLSLRHKIASKMDDRGRFVEDFCTWQENSYYRKIIFESPLGVIAGRLMRSEITRLYHDHVLVKEPFTRQITPWHQDLPYYNIEGSQNCSFWIPVDPVPRESTLEFVAGSHLGPWYTPRTFLDNQAKWFKEGILEDLPRDEELRRNRTILGWPLQPGDVVCFNMLTLHAAAGVCNFQRRVFSVRFMGDDVTFSPRQWPTSPDFPGLNENLVAGSPMDHPLFPVVYKI